MLLFKLKNRQNEYHSMQNELMNVASFFLFIAKQASNQKMVWSVIDF